MIAPIAPTHTNQKQLYSGVRLKLIGPNEAPLKRPASTSELFPEKSSTPRLPPVTDVSSKLNVSEYVSPDKSDKETPLEFVIELLT